MASSDEPTPTSDEPTLTSYQRTMESDEYKFDTWGSFEKQFDLYIKTIKSLIRSGLPGPVVKYLKDSIPYTYISHYNYSKWYDNGMCCDSEDNSNNKYFNAFARWCSADVESAADFIKPFVIAKIQSDAVDEERRVGLVQRTRADDGYPLAAQIAVLFSKSDECTKYYED